MRKKGFTLIEALLSLSIIATLSSLLVANYKVSDNYSSLLNFQTSLTSDLETIKWKAVNSEYYNNQLPVYWSIYLEEGSSSYQIFADLDGDFMVDSNETDSYFGAKQYSSSNNSINKISLSDEVVVSFSTASGFPVFYNNIALSTSTSDLIVELKNNESNMAKLIISNSFGLNDSDDCSCSDSTKYCCSFCSVGSSCVAY